MPYFRLPKPSPYLVPTGDSYREPTVTMTDEADISLLEMNGSYQEAEFRPVVDLATLVLAPGDSAFIRRLAPTANPGEVVEVVVPVAQTTNFGQIQVTSQTRLASTDDVGGGGGPTAEQLAQQAANDAEYAAQQAVIAQNVLGAAVANQATEYTPPAETYAPPPPQQVDTTAPIPSGSTYTPPPPDPVDQVANEYVEPIDTTIAGEAAFYDPNYYDYSQGPLG